MRISSFVLLLITGAVMNLCPVIVNGQYFGRNKPGYKSFKFDVTHTPNFEIYHYLKNDSLLKSFANWSEEWFSMHKKIFKDTFKTKNPLILYSHHSDFQQTNAISSIIGTTTGGVTEALKNRVIMPVAPTLAQTDHVLGHEMVHAFQFNRLLRSDSVKTSSINNIPLWMTEGMAEYFSIGSVDPNTAMWMRDALVNDDFPTLKKLTTESKYFPYRYGHAFWAMVGKTWGDSVILPLYEKTAQYGYEKAIDSIFGINAKTLSGLWKTAMETHYGKYLNDSTEILPGKKIISEKNGGSMNLSPSLSPDGNYLAFFSEKDLFTLDLFLADSKSGKIIKKLSSVTRNHEIDDFSFNESAGTWSPDSKKFAFVIFKKGKNKLAVVNVKRARIIKEIEFENIISFSNPEWSPDGKYIVFSGLSDDISDLYLYNLDTEEITRLTDDFYSNIHPSWSPDGSKIVFSTERINSEKPAKKFSFDLNIIDLDTKSIKVPDIFPGADNLNPCYSYDGKLIYFLSNADGFRNMFAYDTESTEVYKITNFVTGISGLTSYSPAISAAANNDLIAYTHYSKGKYEIHTASKDDFNFEITDKQLVDFTPGVLPPLNHFNLNIVDTTLYNREDKKIKVSPDSIFNVPYQSKFKLDYISNSAGIGVSTGRYNNNNMAGSMSMIFSDIVGNNQLYSILSLNGEIYDFGGQFAYINQTKKFKWGANISHIPYRAGEMFFTKDTLTFKDDGKEYDMPVNNLILDYIRMFEDNISLFTFHSLSQTRRVEAGISSSWYYYRIDRYHNYFDDWGYTVGVKKERMPVPGGNNFQKIDIAYVVDNSFSGLTSPLRGRRARYQLEKYFGVVNFFTGLIDFRQYYYAKPASFAFRIYHYGRYGSGSETNIISPLYIGYPWLIRGYDNVSFYNTMNYGYLGYNSMNYSTLAGSKMVVGNVELRIPLSGPKVLALFNSKYFLTDFNIFFDGGIAWRNSDKVRLAWSPKSFDEKTPIFSAGISLRVNLLGYLVIEPYYAIPFQNGGWNNKTFGVNFVPGW